MKMSMKHSVTQIYFIVLFLTFSFCSKDGVDEATKEDHSQHTNMEQSMVHFTKHDQFIANIKIDTVKESKIGDQSTFLGIAANNEKNIVVISSRLKGRIDNLMLRNPGQAVYTGQLLYSIYSEELLSDEKAYLMVMDQGLNETSNKPITNDLVNASRKKLELWGLTNKQIAALDRDKEVSPVINVYSSTTGSLSQLLVSEGQYVETGTPLFRVVNLNSVWVETQMYTNEISYLNQHPEVAIQFEAFPAQSFVGTLAFSNPILEQNQKVNLVHFAISNLENRIRPGMMAYVHIKYNQRASLVIPKSAVLIEADGETVWIETSNGMYEKRMILTGNDDKTNVEVLFGLEKGEKVVSSGAYLINSEFILKNGANTMGGMKM